MLVAIRRLIPVVVGAFAVVGGLVVTRPLPPPPKPAPGVQASAKPAPARTILVYNRPARFIVVHHQGAAEFRNLAAAEAWFRSIGHDKDMPSAYSAYVTSRGELWQGRGEAYVSAASRGINSVSVAICLLGNLNERPPTDAQLATGGRWLAGALERHPGAVVIEHGDVARITGKPVGTSCPGAFAQRLDTARTLVHIARGMSVAAAKARTAAELKAKAARK
jgi:hypothetical protein